MTQDVCEFMPPSTESPGPACTRASAHHGRVRIDDYEYGRIVVDGREERHDVILTRSGVHPNWWRREGHALVLDDLELVLREKPALLIVGTGTAGNMQPGAGLAEELAARGIRLETMPTADAVRRFNELAGLPETRAARRST